MFCYQYQDKNRMEATCLIDKVIDVKRLKPISVWSEDRYYEVLQVTFISFGVKHEIEHFLFAPSTNKNARVAKEVEAEIEALYENFRNIIRNIITDQVKEVPNVLNRSQ